LVLEEKDLCFLDGLQKQDFEKKLIKKKQVLSPEQKKRQNEYMKRYHQTHRTYFAEYMKKYNKEHKKKC
jgi:hypothetical protein